MAYIAMWAAFGGFVLLIIAINLVELLKWLWFKVIGPAIYHSLVAIYYVATGDADVLRRR